MSKKFTGFLCITATMLFLNGCELCNAFSWSISLNHAEPSKNSIYINAEINSVNYEDSTNFSKLIVSYKKQSDSSYTEAFSTSTMSTKATIPNLAPLTTYTIKIRGIDTEGITLAEKTTNVKTINIDLDPTKVITLSPNYETTTTTEYLDDVVWFKYTHNNFIYKNTYDIKFLEIDPAQLLEAELHNPYASTTRIIGFGSPTTVLGRTEETIYIKETVQSTGKIGVQIIAEK